MAVALFGAGFVILSGIFQLVNVAPMIAVAVGLLTATLAAGVNSFGWHKRYGAMFTARWAMAGLALRIDNEINHFSQEYDREKSKDSSGWNENLRVRVEKATATWVKDAETVLQNFGTAYGAALEPIRAAGLSSSG
ncbi:hypothetical protein VQ045_15760 [Aurantimonas sp. E1-2-R+4]|uniref:hypothetical protein n=1 Tax=Aurantimonas sp. E1-2-R+4 TaxID=3113714 RepID=UPI002F91E04C